MRANAPKRQIFDAVDILTGNDEANLSNSDGIRMLPIETIYPFRNHPFRLYEGERLNEMIESIREHGVLSPVIVWQHDGEYEMLAGHNRLNAAKLAGLKEIPAIVKKDITEEEAYVYVIETNVMQRSFAELLPSEKAAVLTERYEKVVCQGKRNDILEEIARLEGKKISCGHDVHRRKTRDSIGEEYGVGGRNCARFVRINTLNQTLKAMLDVGRITFVAAVDISYMTEEEQKILAEILTDGSMKIGGSLGQELRQRSGKLSSDEIEQMVSGLTLRKNASDASWFRQIKKKYFKELGSEEMRAIVEEALDRYFTEGSEDVQ